MKQESKVTALLNRLGRMNRVLLEYELEDVLKQLGDIGDPSTFTEEDCGNILRAVDSAWRKEGDTSKMYTIYFYFKGDPNGEMNQDQCVGDYELIEWYRKHEEAVEVFKVEEHTIQTTKNA